MVEDRSMVVQPDEIVASAWVDIDPCVPGCRDRMDFAAVERAGRKLLQTGSAQTWPSIVGKWEADRSCFVVLDGRHE